jgi:Holliday junction DNA helicase RuvA
MIGRLRGCLIQKSLDHALIECGGVGYVCSISMWTYDALPSEGQEAILYIEMLLRENDLSLLGFMTQEEKHLYKLIVKVDGIGPKLALTALGALSPTSLLQAIRNRDIKKLVTISGVGKKTAEKLCFELSEKLGGLGGLEGFSDSTSANDTWESDLISALVNLGFKEGVVMPVVGRLRVERPPLSEAVRLSLKALQ